MRFEDYYDVLGLKPDADAAAVKQAYRRLARVNHPDLNASEQAHATMLKVNEAYEVLSDPQRRAAFDGVRRRQQSKPRNADMPGDWKQGFQFEGQPTAGRSGEGFSDFFTGMFGRAAKPEPADAKPERGADEHVKLAIAPKDAAEGAVHTVTVRSLAPDEHGHRAVALRRVQVQVPKGIKAGQHIRLTGQGSAGRGGADTGDLYVEIQFKGEPAQGANADVHERLPLAPWEAALGAEVATTTPAGPVTVTVPPDTPHGKRLRLRGQGLTGKPAGDMVLEVNVVLPPSTLKGARTAYQAMEEILGPSFQPRTETKHG